MNETMNDACVAEVADNGALEADRLIAGQSSPIVVVTRGRTRIIILNRPAARNALTRDMRRALAGVLTAAAADDGIAAMIVAGAGGAFCAGVDIKESRAAPAPMVRPHPGEALRAFGKPVIAAVDGPCITGGLEVALSCSFIIASRRATFADTHAKVGLFPAWGMTALLPGAIGVRRARQMVATAAPIDARTALEWGLVNEVVEPAALLPRCFALAEAMTAQNPTLLRRVLALLDRDVNLTAAFAAEDDASARWRSEKTQNNP